MGYSVAQAIIKLHGAGVPARRGYPGGLMPHITDTVAAVNLHKCTPEATTLVAQVCTPMAKGVYACEDTANIVAQVWTDAGAIVSYGGHSFDGKSGLYQMAVYGEWRNAVEEPGDVTNPAD